MHKPSLARNVLALSLLVPVTMVGCNLDRKPDAGDSTVISGPTKTPLLEAVPIWVSSSVITAGEPGTVFIELNNNAASTGEPIVIQPMLMPTTTPGAPRVEDIIDLSVSKLSFTIASGKTDNTSIQTVAFGSSKWPAQTVYLLVRDDKGLSWVYGTVLVLPTVTR